jgi:hypothetical protein
MAGKDHEVDIIRRDDSKLHGLRSPAWHVMNILRKVKRILPKTVHAL